MTAEPSDESRPTGGRSGGDVVDRLTSGGSATEAAVEDLRALTESDPDRLEGALSDLATAVVEGRGEPALDDRLAVVGVIADVAAARRDVASEAVAALATVLEDPALEAPALRALARVAGARPDAVDPVLESVGRRLTGEPIPTRYGAVGVLDVRADADPASVSPLTPQLVDVVVATDRLDAGHPSLPDHERSRRYDRTVTEQRLARRAGAVLEAVATSTPGAVAPELDRLGGILDPGNGRDLELKGRVASIVRAVAAETPEPALDVVDPLLAVVEADRYPPALRADAAGTLATLADGRFEATTGPARSAIPALRDLLADGDPAVRANAGALTSYLAQRYPGEVATFTDTLVDRLDDDQVPIRAAAVWALASVDTDASREALRETAANDPDPEVRALAGDRLSSRSDRHRFRSRDSRQ